MRTCLYAMMMSPDSAVNVRMKLSHGWSFWVLGLAALGGILVLPLSSGVTRAATLLLGLSLWFGLIRLLWARSMARWLWFGVTLLLAGLICLPARRSRPTNLLRDDYVWGLRRYTGVAYYWGGESRLGIDCSGLIRCGLVDALMVRGVLTLDGGLIRQAGLLWWRDTNARTMGAGSDGNTRYLFDAASLRDLDHDKLLHGDLAVTADGVHVLAYSGNRRWIQADPAVEAVIEVEASDRRNVWLRSAVRVVRWTVLCEDE
jgi:hypothetical protein